MKNILFIIILSLALHSCKNEQGNSVTVENEVIENQKDSATIDFSKYTLNTIDNLEETLTLKKDKLYILDFWYLECAPCVKDHKVIAKHADSLKTKGIEVIGMSIDRSRAKWRLYLKSHNYNWLNYNQFSQDNVLYRDLDIKFFPRYLVVNDKGEILNESNRFKKALEFLKNRNG